MAFKGEDDQSTIEHIVRSMGQWDEVGEIISWNIDYSLHHWLQLLDGNGNAIPFPILQNRA